MSAVTNRISANFLVFSTFMNNNVQVGISLVKLRVMDLRKDTLPDVSVMTRPVFGAPISRVGMQKIEMPVLLNGLTLPARIDAFVSLDKSEARGIHMSRLYLDLVEVLRKQSLCGKTLHVLLRQFLAGHSQLSRAAEISVQFQLPVERAGLLSGEPGHRLYPVNLRGVIEEDFRLFFSTEILYSSTCPCSAALARELVRGQFVETHAGKELDLDTVADWLTSEKVKIATPHAQRSIAKLAVELADPQNVGFAEWISVIDHAESALGTPVQAAVKRVDEQEFARLNGENLMFCEDAARKLRAALESSDAYLDYSIEVEHQESLHPHSAVAKVVKGRPGGYRIE